MKHSKTVSVASVIASLAALVLCFGPIYYLAFHIMPCDDDFITAITTKLTFVETGSVIKTLKAAIDYVVWEYNIWQGTWSFNFLECLQPGVWGDEYYWIGPILVVTTFVSGYCFCGYCLFRKLIKTDNSLWFLLITVPLCIWQQYILYPSQAYFWWTGASYYLMYHGWAMFMLGALVLTCQKWSDQYSKGQKIAAAILLSLAGCIIGGGNYTTALMLDVILGIILVYDFVCKKDTKWLMLAITVCSALGLLISVMAPGNTAHIELDFDERVTLPEAIWITIRDGSLNIISWTHAEIVLFFIMLLPIMYLVIRNSSFKFRVPGLFTLLSYGVYLSGYAPASYTIHGYAPGRMINIYYLSFFMLILANLLYWVGWLNNKGMLKVFETKAFLQRGVLTAALISGMLGAMVVLKFRLPSTLAYKFRTELSNDVYANYDRFMAERYDYINKHKGERIELRALPLEYRSVITFYRDFDDVPESKLMRSAAGYYGVEEISAYTDKPVAELETPLPQMQEEPVSVRELELVVCIPEEDQTSEEKQWIQTMCDSFDELHPEWKITYEFGIDSGKADVFIYDSRKLDSLIQNNAIAPIEGDYAETVKAGMAQVPVQTVTRNDGAIYGFPLMPVTFYMFYDRGVFTEEDVGSLDAMLEKGKVAIDLTDPIYSGSFYAAGIDIGDDGDSQITSYMNELQKNPKYINATPSVAFSMLEQGQCDAYFCETGRPERIMELLDDYYGVAVYPSISVGDKLLQLRPVVYSKAIGVGTSCKDQDVAMALAAYLTGEEAQKLHYEMSGCVPSLRTIITDPAIKGDSTAAACVESAYGIGYAWPPLGIGEDFDQKDKN